MIVLHAYGSDVLGVTGGHERFVRMLSMELARHGIKVVVAHTGKDEITSGIMYIRVSCIRVAQRFAVPLSLRKLVYLVKLADIVHVHSPTNPFAFTTSLIAFLLSKPLVSTVLCYCGDCFHHKLIMRLISPLTVAMETLAILFSRVIHVENLGDYFKVKKIKNRVVYAEPFIDKMHKKSPKSPHVRSHRHYRIVLYIGRIDYAKGVHILVSALRYLPNNVKLIVAGPIIDKKYFAKLKKLVKNHGLTSRVLFLGYINEEIKEKLYELCSVVAIPSLSNIVEAYNIVATEAWVYGKPVVASPVGALRYRIRNAVNGFLAERRDPKALAEAILKALSLERVPRYQPMFDTVRTFKVIYSWLATKNRKRAREGHDAGNLFIRR